MNPHASPGGRRCPKADVLPLLMALGLVPKVKQPLLTPVPNARIGGLFLGSVVAGAKQREVREILRNHPWHADRQLDLLELARRASRVALGTVPAHRRHAAAAAALGLYLLAKPGTPVEDSPFGIEPSVTRAQHVVAELGCCPALTADLRELATKMAREAQFSRSPKAWRLWWKAVDACEAAAEGVSTALQPSSGGDPRSGTPLPAQDQRKTPQHRGTPACQVCGLRTFTMRESLQQLQRDYPDLGSEEKLKNRVSRADEGSPLAQLRLRTGRTEAALEAVREAVLAGRDPGKLANADARRKRRQSAPK